ncbi:Cytochrome P450 [Melia azedarach]|uniref:Cytochrome P450 n=2 Tax=Melia azedarach TaxID=155640 RepID=A0ACC1Y6W6_MELAZ|nr:Cytochrome P450 [Melia azedarach]KAJ4718759.1 Cytochrome P450 [Melia azedarach]
MELQFLLTLFTFLLFFFLKQVLKSRNPVQKSIPGPWKLPLIGNVHNLIGLLPHHALRELAKKYGPLMQLQMGEISMIVISSPEMAKEVMKTHDLTFAQRPEFLAFKILYEKTGMPIALAPYGEYWRQMRKLCLLELLSNKRVQSFSHIREDEIVNVIQSIRSSGSSPVNLSTMLSSFTSTVTCRAAFGNRFEKQDVFVSLNEQIVKLSGGFAFSEAFPSLSFIHVITGMKAKIVKVHAEADKILENIINEHRESRIGMKLENSGEENLLDVLLRVQETGSLGFQITTKNIKAIIWNIFAGGTDSSSTTIEWTMSELMKNPRVMEKAQAEVREKFKGKKTISEADIQGLNYLKLIVKETLRLHPPNPLLVPRESREACEINGYEIPVKTKLLVNAWAIGRDPKHWKEPESFIPERFNDNSIDFKGNDFEYIPFGAGRRICPGMAFGLANIELPLAQLLYNFNWEIPGGIAPQDMDMSEAFGAIVSRKNDLCLIATPYSPDHR